LLDRLGAGVHSALNAGQCATEPGTAHHQTALQLVAHLSAAIRALEAARAIVVGGMEGEVTR